MWTLRVLWLVIDRDLLEHRYTDDVTEDCFLCFVQYYGLLFTDPWRIWASPQRKAECCLQIIIEEMQLINPKVNGVILQVMLFILNTSSRVLWSFMLFNISCINFFSLCRAVFLLEWMPQTCDSFEGRWDFWLIFWNKVRFLADLSSEALKHKRGYCKCLK